MNVRTANPFRNSRLKALLLLSLFPNLAPAETAPALPVFFSSANMVVSAGAETILSWYAPTATSCTASGGWSGDRPTQGHEAVSLSQATRYTLSCAGPSGTGSKTFEIKILGAIDFTDKPIDDPIYTLDETDLVYDFSQPLEGCVYPVLSAQYPSIMDAIIAVNADGDGYEYSYAAIVVEPGRAPDVELAIREVGDSRGVGEQLMDRDL